MPPGLIYAYSCCTRGTMSHLAEPYTQKKKKKMECTSFTPTQQSRLHPNESILIQTASDCQSEIYEETGVCIYTPNHLVTSPLPSFSLSSLSPEHCPILTMAFFSTWICPRMWHIFSETKHKFYKNSKQCNIIFFPSTIAQPFHLNKLVIQGWWGLIKSEISSRI